MIEVMIKRDSKALFQLASESYGESPWTKQQIEESFDVKWLTTYGYKIHQQWVGFVQIQCIGDEAEVLNIGVHPDYRHQGIAKALLEAVLPKASSWLLEVRASNHAAQSLYKTLGFKKIAIRKGYYHYPREDAWIMQRK